MVKVHDPDARLSDDDLDPRDDLSDTIGDKRATLSPDAAKYNSAASESDQVKCVVTYPVRFKSWLERYAVRHGTDVAGVFDFAMRQIWRDDPDRVEGLQHSMRKADFDPGA